ncbi:ABC transporter permease [Isoptericola sp. NEAU-Y5]|uniref:ABC transporter permease n=1 Tax=Isoptericola luteus TaxID=2879484 RepID=A0ABS7ZCI5_9MICO|nr:ABC transporter permease [Isoptericola sp. NEAU-Y5]MCA5892742.1 ABC transporter permease [Isoptericola sp. NEAU-Y5]
MTTDTTTGAASGDRGTPGGAGNDPLRPPEPIVPTTSSSELRAVAAQHGLQQMGVRPPLRAYIKDVVSRWAFIRVLGTATAYSKNQNNYLGQLWAVLNPVLNAVTYILIFGFLLNTNRGVENVIAFIVIGTFLFRFVEQSVHGGARSIAQKSNLIRSLHFPRAVLPIAQVVSLLATLVPSLVVMCAIVLLSGLSPRYPTVYVTWQWLLLPCLVALLWLFNTGLAFMVARAVAITPDLDNIISFVLRLVMYGSGVIFPVTHYVSNLSDGVQAVVGPILEYQPVAVFLYLGRSTLTQEPNIPPDPMMWAWAAGWAVVVFVVGFIVFWRGEERYGRD